MDQYTSLAALHENLNRDTATNIFNQANPKAKKKEFQGVEVKILFKITSVNNYDSSESSSASLSTT